MPDQTGSENASDRTILVAPGSTEISAALQQVGFSTITWPQVAMQPPETFAGLDEAIENLFGYDWLIFVKADAARFFLSRFEQQGHDISNLDSLRVCAIGEATAAVLEQSKVHVDVVATKTYPNAVIDSIATYAGGRDLLQRLNFLIPQASIGRDYLKNEFEDAEARADVIIAYQTVATVDLTRLIALQTMLLTGSVDGVIFANDSEVTDFARVFDTNNLGRLWRNVAVLVPDDQTATVAENLGAPRPLTSASPSSKTLAEALVNHFKI
jgi:uroporphyrinogen III methyltransferase/synthase